MERMENNQKATKYCEICDCETEHEKGIFKSLTKGSDVFESKTSSNDDLKDASQTILELIRINNSMENTSKRDLPDIGSHPEISNFREKILPHRIKAFKCVRCGHLIPLPKLP
jgi:hypothetical protein